MGKKEEECRYYREQLVKDEARLADLEARGNDACSAYDLRFGYDAEFNKQLKRNHIAYDLKQLERCPKPVEQVTLFAQHPEIQAAVDQGAERIKQIALEFAPDAHLEAQYEDQVSGDFDF